MMTMNRYKACFSIIAVPSGLVEQTRVRIKQERSKTASRPGIPRYALAISCLVLVMLAVSLLPRLTGSPLIDTSSVLPSRSDVGSTVSGLPGSSELSEPQNTDNTIKINELGELSDSPPMSAGPCINRTETWTFEQYCEVLGFDPTPSQLPEGLAQISPNTRDIDFCDDRRVDFYNTWYLLYADGQSESAKSVSIHINPSFIPYWSAPRAYQLQGSVQLSDVSALLNLGEISEINGTEVTIWHKDKGTVWDYLGGGGLGETVTVTDYYCADFEYKGAGFTVTAQNGITQQEFLSVLEGIIK